MDILARQTDRSERQRDRKTDRQTDRQKNSHYHINCELNLSSGNVQGGRDNFVAEERNQQMERI